MWVCASRGQRPETVKVGTIDVVMYAKERLPNTEFSLVLGEWVGKGGREGRVCVCLLLFRKQ